MAEYIEREAIGRVYMGLCLAKSKLAKSRKGAAFFQSDLLPETEPTVKELFRLVMAAPAADVAPVVRGRWEESMVSAPDYYGLVFGWKCSECGYNFEDRSKHRKKPSFMKFCPNCGSKMDLE